MLSRLSLFAMFLLAAVFAPGTAGAYSNEPTPALAATVEAQLDAISRDTKIRGAAKSNPALNAYLIQVKNQLKHVSLSFAMRDNTYTHDFVLAGPYPKSATELVSKRASEFLEAASGAAPLRKVTRLESASDRLELLMAQQKEWVKKITTSPFEAYAEMRERLKTQGENAPFPELGSNVEYLRLHLLSDESLVRLVNTNGVLNHYWHSVMRELDAVTEAGYPYLDAVEAIQRTLEFLDVYFRAHDPTRSPKLYHSDRYEYYGHFLKGEIPDHIVIPTIVSLGATDILKARGVPLGFVGVNVEITWVDGFWQTPYEFWMHDVNHTRRMWQFLKETAEARGLTTLEFARRSDRLVRDKLMPLIAIAKGDDDVTRNRKRLLKVLLFEILHEDALAADVDVIVKAILRPPNLITPFEEMKGTDVTYVMEPGATTLAYTYRKLAHDFYDMPGERLDNIVAEKFRTREGIVEVALRLGSALGADLRREVLEYYVSTDLGFPRDFKATVEKDIAARPGETVPLDQEHHTDLDSIAIVAELAHAKWQTTTAYFERWKIAQTAFRDGTGINDGKFVADQASLEAYWKDRGIPKEYHRYYLLRKDPTTRRMALFEDIQHLPQRHLAPNNQYENVEGAKVALRLVHRIAEEGLHFADVASGMTWIRTAAEEQNREWKRRNRHWAKGDPTYDREWTALRANHKLNNLNFFKVALETELAIDSSLLEATQQTLLQEALRRIYVDIANEAAVEARLAQTGDAIHAAWQKRSGYKTRFKRAEARLDDGQLVDSEARLEQYFRENAIPYEFRAYFELRRDGVYEDLQNLPNRHLATNHKSENEYAADESLAIVERLWRRGVSLRDERDATRWVRAAAQLVHEGVLRRNANGSRENPEYTVHWLDLPAVNQSHDLASVKAALLARFEFNPASIAQEQKILLLDAIARLEREIVAGGVRRACAIALTASADPTSLD